MIDKVAQVTDQFDVVLDLASSTLSDGSTVEAMRLARGVLAMEAYMDRLTGELEALRKVAADADRVHTYEDSPAQDAQLQYEEAMFDLGGSLAAWRKIKEGT